MYANSTNPMLLQIVERQMEPDITVVEFTVMPAPKFAVAPDTKFEPLIAVSGLPVCAPAPLRNPISPDETRCAR